MADLEWIWNGSSWVEYTNSGGSGYHTHTTDQITGLDGILDDLDSRIVASGTIDIADVTGLTSALTALGNTVTLFGNVARNHPTTAAALPAPPTVSVIWITYGATSRPAAFNAAGDIWFNEEVS